MDLGVLNTIIALVVVLLVLSLLVQAIQTLFKKLLKLKSKQIEGTLKDLYEQAISGENPPEPAPLFQSRLLQPLSKLLLAIKNLVRPGSNVSTQKAVDFKNDVLAQFKNIGRKTLFGGAVLDSLSKEDLFKILGKMESEKFFPDYVTKFTALCTEIDALKGAIEDLSKNNLLRGAASTKIAEISSILAPVFNDAAAIVDGQSQVKPNILFADLLRLGKLDLPSVLTLMDDAQTAIAQEKEQAAKEDNQGEVNALQNLSAALTKLAGLVGKLSQTFVNAVSPLRNKLEQIEVWFDTVTQSFDERYARHMRSVSICLSIIVVIVLNADFFQIYKSLSTNAIQRNMIADAGVGLLKDLKAAQATQSPTPTPTPTPTPPPAGQTTTPGANANQSPTPTPTPQEVIEVKEALKAVDQLTNTYESFGFHPLSSEQLNAFFWSWFGSKYNKDIKNGVETPYWTKQTAGDWWESRKDNLVTLLGWAVMVMLLSVGAPFWQDTLESLFGIKNLLRQKSGTQNIETASGAGQPRQ